jgi:RNA polymerase sigma-70 factor (ECF subfamily)
MARFASSDSIRAAIAGDRFAIERLIAEIWAPCYRLAVRAIGNRSLAQDAAQETCAIVYRKVRSLRTPDAFDAWLYRITMREASRMRRQLDIPATELVQTLDDREQSTDVWAALNELRPELRDVVVLFYIDDLPGEDIARILRISHGAVRTRLSRARTLLRNLLDEQYSLTTPLKEPHHAI